MFAPNDCFIHTRRRGFDVIRKKKNVFHAGYVIGVITLSAYARARAGGQWDFKMKMSNVSLTATKRRLLFRIRAEENNNNNNNVCIRENKYYFP